MFILTAMAGILLVMIGFAYFISSVWEKERRAAIFGCIQFLLMSVLVAGLFFLESSGFFKTDPGFTILTFGFVMALGLCLLLMPRIGLNPNALKGTKGLIVGTVKRNDERDIMFARNRSLRLGTNAYKTYYEMHPEYEKLDNLRRERGGPLGQPGSVDRPNDRPNVAATMASLSIPLHLSTPEKFNPSAHPEFKGLRVALRAKSASERVKGFALNLGADLVGIAEINPLWIYSNRGEIFDDRWDDWGKTIELTHPYAVVFATEMAFELVGTAPHTPTTIASMGNYAKGAFIATQLAGYIANLGYSATANHRRH